MIFCSYGVVALVLFRLVISNIHLSLNIQQLKRIKAKPEIRDIYRPGTRNGACIERQTGVRTDVFIALDRPYSEQTDE